MKTTTNDFKRIDNDVNGNPRYVCHFLNFITAKDEVGLKDDLKKISYLYEIAIAKAKKAGGKKYHNKSFGGGLVFTSYNLEADCEFFNKIINQ